MACCMSLRLTTESLPSMPKRVKNCGDLMERHTNLVRFSPGVVGSCEGRRSGATVVTYEFFLTAGIVCSRSMRVQEKQFTRLETMAKFRLRTCLEFRISNMPHRARLQSYTRIW